LKFPQQITYDIIKRRKEFRIKLLGHFLLIGLFSSFFQIAVGFYENTTININTELYFALILGTLFVLNRKGLHNIASIGTFIVVNLALFFAFRLEPNVGTEFYFFPMILLAFVLHDSNDWIKTSLFAFFPIFLFFINTYEYRHYVQI